MKHVHHSSSTARWSAACLALFAPIALALGADWQVKDAPIRFKLSLGTSPTEKSAGYFVHLPDGGLLPQPSPLTTVMTESGKTLASYAMWYNRSGGLALVFESDSSSGNVYVYVTAAPKLKLWTPASGLTPSPITCVQPGAGSLDTAKTLGRMGPVNASTHYLDRPGNARAPLCLQGDLTGRTPPASFYMLTYVKVDDPGSTWVAPILMQGKSEVRVDDAAVSFQKKNEKFGGSGQMMNLAAGLHKVEMMSACDASVDYTRGALVVFSWKPPHTTEGELGGVYTTNNAQYAGTPRQESRVLDSGEIVESGSCTLKQIDLRDGGPAASFSAEAGDVFWFTNETPTIVYTFTALTAGNPTNTTYTWSVGDAAKPTGPKLYWFLAGQKEHTITLTATWSNKVSRCALPLYAFTTVKSSLDDPSTRESFRRACLSMIKSYPADADPAASWDKSMWDTFYDVQELGKGGQLLAEVLVNRAKFFKKKILPEKKTMLEDILFNSLCHVAPDKALEWLKDEEKESKKPERRNDYKIMQAEIYMYHKKNLEEAKKILTPLAAQSSTEVAAMASIRLGDVAFLEKNMNEANRYWGSVQSRVKLTDNVLKGDDAVKWKDDTAEEADKDKKPDEKDSEKDKKKSVRPPASLKPLTPLKPLSRKDSVANWKRSAVIDTSMASSVITLMNQKAYLDALHELQKWERNFPQSKMSSDYIIQEAQFYMTLGNNKRARATLEAYVDNVDASSYLADAAELLLQCMINDKETDAVLTKYCEKMRKRFQFHPFVERLDSMLRQMRAGEVKTQPTSDD